MNKHKQEFIDEVERQLVHMGIKRDYLAHRMETDLRDESAQNRAKAKLELDALEQKVAELQAMGDWLHEKTA